MRRKYSRKQTNYTYLKTVLVIVIGLLLADFKSNTFSMWFDNLNTNSSYSKAISSSTSSSENTATTNDNQLANLNYKSGESAVVEVNNNKSTLNVATWKTNKVVYGNLDSLNRTANGATAYLEARNVANDSLRTTQYVKPTGWHQKVYNGEAIINRGHLIAYSLSKGIDKSGSYDISQESGDQNNLKNLFTQTAFSNQEIQTIYETKVRNSLKSGHKIIYQVTPIFRNQELMARGVHIQAISTDGSLNFNVYIYNVEPNFLFNYSDGTSTIDRSMKVPEPADAPHFNN